MPLETKIYQKDNRLKLNRVLKACVKDFFGSHFLAKQLATRDIRAQYRQSYLGIIWAFITPVFSALVWIMLSVTGTVKLSDTGIPYPVYVFSGTLIWSILKEAINLPTSNTNAARSILTKINFPKEALILSGMYKLFFNSAIKILLLVLIVILFGLGFSWSLLLFPLVIVCAVLFGVTIGLFITPFGLIYTDVGKIITFGLGLVMYITPVVYAIPQEGVMRTIMEINPFTPMIIVARNVIVGSNPEFLSYFLSIIGISFPLFFIGLLFYRISIPIIVERLSA